MNRKALTLATLALIVTACGTRTPATPQPQQPEEPSVVEGLFFELDTATRTVRPLPAATSGGVSRQAYYATGFSTTQVVTDENDSVYNVQFTLKNNTNQGMGADSDLTVFVPSFSAQTATNYNIAGGGIVNADGYLPDTFYPYKSFSNYVKPGDGVVFTLAIQVPAPATKAVFALAVNAAQDYNQIPITDLAFMQPAYGKFNDAGFKAGPADQTRFNKPFSLTTCPSGKIYMTDQNGLWRLDAHSTTLVSSNALYRVNTFIECTDSDGLLLSVQGNNQIYYTSSLFFSPSLIAGAMESGLANGDANAARFSNPRQITRHGTDVYVADYNNRAVRKLTKQTDGNYLTSTVLTMPAGEAYVEGVAVDPQGNIYFGTTTGLWRKAAQSNQPVKIVPKTTNYMPITIKWHPNGMLLVSELNESRIRAYTPSSTNLDQPWVAIKIAGNGLEATSYTRGEPRKNPIKTPLGLTVNSHGTIYFSQFAGQNVMRIDRMK